MKTKTIIFLAQTTETLINSLSDFIPAHKHVFAVNHYIRATEIYGFIVYESIFNRLTSGQYNYDRETLKSVLTKFQWQMLNEIEQKYINIILKNDNVFESEVKIECELICRN